MMCKPVWLQDDSATVALRQPCYKPQWRDMYIAFHETGNWPASVINTSFEKTAKAAP